MVWNRKRLQALLVLHGSPGAARRHMLQMKHDTERMLRSGTLAEFALVARRVLAGDVLDCHAVCDLPAKKLVNQALFRFCCSFFEELQGKWSASVTATASTSISVLCM